MKILNHSLILWALFAVQSVFAADPAAQLNALVGSYTLVSSGQGICHAEIEVERNDCYLNRQLINKGLKIAGVPRSTGLFVFSGCEFNEGPIEREYTKNSGGAAIAGWEVPYKLQKEASFDGSAISFQEFEYRFEGVSFWNWFPHWALERKSEFSGSFDGKKFSYKVSTGESQDVCEYQRK